ncbi:DUF3987 domain-containing protein [Vineibacter terrae]|uniref:DUF3987 domain-containing protein n=1 Tax=Vineibacter terrae TaxID=2586908 RepID=A0A5C8PES6_9HYPH|nr:DUF3987 domain-containing protein [Vineibacter terrae]
MSARDLADLTHTEHGKPLRWWRYSDTFAVARFVTRAGRTIAVPAVGNGTAWYWHVPPGSLPIYGAAALPLRPDAPVLVVQGEEAADAARDLLPDHVCVTWAGGPNAVNKADVVALSGRDIILWPDKDMPSLTAMARFSNRLRGVARSVVQAQVPSSWPAGWHFARPLPAGVTPDGLRQMVRGMTAEAAAPNGAGPPCHDALADGRLHEPACPGARPEPAPASGAAAASAPLPDDDWPAPDLSFLDARHGDLPAFPVDVLPPFWRAWTGHAAGAVAAPVDYVALSLLAVAAGLIGDARGICPVPGWREPCVLWAALAGAPSSGRTRGMDAMLRLARALEHGLGTTGEAACRRHAAAREAARAIARLWRADVRNMVMNGAEPDDLPQDAMEPPLPRRLVLDDPCIGTVADALRGNARSILLAPDALGGWLGHVARQRAGADRRHWLKAWSARPWTFARARPLPLDIPHAAVSILGTLNPGASAPDDDLAARFLFVSPRRAELRPWSPASDEGDAAALDALARLRDMPAAARDVTLTPDARLSLDAFRRAHDEALDGLEGRQAAWWDKGPGTVLRLAGVLAFLDWAARPAGTAEPAQIPGWAMRAAAGLWWDYLWPHACAVLDTSGDDGRRHVGKVLTWLAVQRLREVSREQIRRDALSQAVDAAGADAIIAALVAAGCLRAVAPQSKGPGRRRRRWQVNPRLWDARCRPERSEGPCGGCPGNGRVGDSPEVLALSSPSQGPSLRSGPGGRDPRNLRNPIAGDGDASLLPGEARREEVDAVVRQPERLGGAHQRGADAGLERRMPGIGHDHAIGLGPGAAQLVGRDGWADDIVAPLHDGARQMADAIERLPRPAFGQEHPVDEVVGLDARQCQREAAGLGLQRALGGRIQRRAGGLVAAPGAGGRLVPGGVGVDQPPVVVAQNVATLGGRQVPDEIAPRLGEHGAHALEEPLHLLVAPQEDAAQDEAEAAVGIVLAIGKRQRRAPGAAEHQPLPHAQVLAQLLEVVDQVRRRVVGDVAQRQGAPGAALVEDDDAIEGWIEEAAMHRRRAGAGAAVQEHDGHAVGIAALFPVERMAAVDRQHAAGVGDDVREQFRP